MARRVFGAFPKYDNGNYTFLMDYLPYASGDGMEHRDSTVISGAGNLKTGAPQMIGTVSHEFFHSWNVERIRPKSLEPFDFERAIMSGELWFQIFDSILKNEQSADSETRGPDEYRSVRSEYVVRGERRAYGAGSRGVQCCRYGEAGAFCRCGYL